MPKIVRNGVEYGGGSGYTKKQIDEMLDNIQSDVDANTTNISNQQEAVADGGNGYAIINGKRLYLQTTEPTGDIPDGSVWIGGEVSS
jgi:hypothetical protein